MHKSQGLTTLTITRHKNLHRRNGSFHEWTNSPRSFSRDAHSNKHRSECHFGFEATRNTREKKLFIIFACETDVIGTGFSPNVCAKKNSRNCPIPTRPGLTQSGTSTPNGINALYRKTNTQNAITDYPIPAFVMGNQMLARSHTWLGVWSCYGARMLPKTV